MKIWRIRYSFDGYPGHHDEYFLDEQRAIREGLEFESVGTGARACVLEITVQEGEN